MKVWGGGGSRLFLSIALGGILTEIHPPASASQVVGLKACATTACQSLLIFNYNLTLMYHLKTTEMKQKLCIKGSPWESTVAS